jgi:penicillin-binding protein 1C
MKILPGFIVRHYRVAFAAAVLFAVAAFSVTYVYLPDYRNAIQEAKSKAGRAVTDRNGKLLRIFPDRTENFSLWRPLNRIPLLVRRSFIAAEDKRFYYHPGFDPIAVVRAVITNLRAGRVVSGASTITQQVVRLIRPRPRTYGAKIYELLAGVKMEWQLSKDDILELHLNLSPTGGNIRGAALGALIYFSKDLEHLNASEAATLASLPRSPSRFDPRRARGRKFVLHEKDRVLERMARQGWISRAEEKRLNGSSVDFRFMTFPLEAPHLVDFVMNDGVDHGPVIGTTVDLPQQRTLEKILHSHIDRLASMGIEQAGALLVSTDRAEVIAMVGSLGYGRHNLGYNNAVLAARGPGSTLKPFLYSLGLKRGFQAVSEIPDTFRIYPTPYGDYLPFNADRRSYGPVTIRQALGNSLNVPAVKLIKRLGVDDFYRFLERLDLTADGTRNPEHYGLGLAIGNMEVSLYRLVQAYAAFARRGSFRPLSYLEGQEEPAARQVFSPEVAYVVSDILADPAARLLTFGNPESLNFGYPVCVKTGTSSNYRDAWIIGYTPRHVIGIWAGNFSGRSNNGRTGAQVCAPILKDIVRHLYGDRGPGRFERPSGVRDRSVCWISGEPASKSCPYTYRELFVGTPSEGRTCEFLHEKDPHFYLDANYARWLHRRERMYESGRFRLGTPQFARNSVKPVKDNAVLLSRHAGPVVRTSRVSIVSPNERDHFVLSPDFPSRVRFRAIAEPLVSHIVWYLNGVELERTPPPYEFLWNPLKGEHKIHAVTPDGEAAQVDIHVE